MTPDELLTKLQAASLKRDEQEEAAVVVERLLEAVSSAKAAIMSRHQANTDKWESLASAAEIDIEVALEAE